MATRTLLVLATVLGALALAPPPAAANPCATGCGEVDVEPCVGAFAEGYSTLGATWTLTYRHPGGTVTATSTGYAPPPAAVGGECWIPGCYTGTLSNDLGFHKSRTLCIE